MGSGRVKYEAWFAGEESDDFEGHWAIDEREDWDARVAEQFLDYAYSNMDGWEWMPKDNGKTVVRVKQAKKNQPKDFTFILEYDPVFYTQEVTK